MSVEKVTISSRGQSVTFGPDPPTDKDGVVIEDEGGALPAKPPPVLGNVSGVRLTPVGLLVDGQATFEQLTGCIQVLSSASKVTPWALGDAVNALQGRWGEKYAAWVERTGLSYKRLRNLAYVCRVFQLSRRRDNLEFKHHELVAAFEAEEQERWLDEAVKMGWSAGQLKAMIEMAKAPPADDDKSDDDDNDDPPARFFAPGLGIQPTFEWEGLDGMYLEVQVLETGAVYLRDHDAHRAFCISHPKAASAADGEDDNDDEEAGGDEAS